MTLSPRISLGVAALLVATALTAQADEPVRIAESQELGWRAVGRLDVAGGPSCTATLISDRAALTAAHCVIDRLTGAPLRPVQITLRAGLRYGRAAGAQRAQTLALWPRDRPFEACAAGLAAIGFSAPFDADRIAAFDVGGDAQTLSLAGYGPWSPGAPTVESGCSLSGAAEAARLTGCAAAPGAALIAEAAGRRALVAVVSADDRCGPEAARALPVAPHLADLLDALATAPR
ncbi:MAG: trypsin-like serine peptidase [Rubrimonas sp.]